MSRVLRKLRYLFQRAFRLLLLAVWFLLLLPITLPARILLRVGKPQEALRLALIASARNPYTPGLLYLLVRIHKSVGNTSAAAQSALALARNHHRMNAVSKECWSDYLDTEPHWTCEIALASPVTKSGEVDLTNGLLTSIQPMPVALTASVTDGYAAAIAATSPAVVIADRGDVRQLLIAEAIHRWNGANVKLVGITHIGHQTEHATRVALKSAKLIAKLDNT